MKMPCKRLLLKLSGEMLNGSEKFGIDQMASLRLAKALLKLRSEGFELAIVIGGGNIFRGIHLNEGGMQRTAADHMGMLATIMNGIVLQESLRSLGCDAKVMSALECPKVVESYNWKKALEAISSGSILIFVGGTGNPYFSTDSAAALRASEINADILLKATKVDGIFNKDPLKFSDAKKYDELSYSQFLAEKLEVMDATAIALCRSNSIPILVFNMQLLFEKDSIGEILSNKQQGTLVKGD